MAGRRSHHESGEGKARRAQSPKQVRGFARGHGAHHRHQPGKGAPRPVGSGRDRTETGARRNDFERLGDDDLSDLSSSEKKSNVERSIEELGDAQGFGARMEGLPARGLVLEVRKGNFLTRMLGGQADLGGGGSDALWKAGGILRTVVRGTMQQFDLGLSSVVAPGDEIEVVVPPLSSSNELYQSDLHAVLTKVLPRRSEFRRLHPSGRAIQTLAANASRVFVVASAGEPGFRPGFVDRVLVCAAASGLPAALILNKIDLGVPEADEALLDVYRGLGIPVFKLSLLDSRSPRGDVEPLLRELAGQRTVLTGHSGVGKSTLLLALDPQLNPETVRTGEVSTQTGKGTHTTTHARLFNIALPGGAACEVIDTPGVREFTPADTDRRNLWGWFPEIARLQGQCAYADCTHAQGKGCAILAAVERGEIHPRRHQSYVRIYETLPN